MSDPRFPLAPACPDGDGAVLEPDLDYYRGCYEDVSRDFWFLLGVIRKARDLVRTRGATQIKTSELLDVLGRDDRELLHGLPAKERGGPVLTAEEAATVDHILEHFISAEDDPEHELVIEAESLRAKLRAAVGRRIRRSVT